MIDRVGGYDAKIEEVHHTQKKDAPSGTAITLAEGVISEPARQNRVGELRAGDRTRDEPDRNSGGRRRGPGSKSAPCAKAWFRAYTP